MSRTRERGVVLLALLAALVVACTADHRPPGVGDGTGVIYDLGTEPADLRPADGGGADLGHPHPPADGGSAQDAGPFCRIDSDCLPGTYCKSGSCTFDCRMPSDCSLHGGFDCVNGRCVQAVECTSDADCQPPQTVCDGDGCVAGCLGSGCGAGLRCNTASGHCEQEQPAGCQRDGDCAADLRCNLGTGRCEPRQQQDLPLGDDCQHGVECASGMCLGLTVAGAPAQVCAQLCCSEFDCPASFGCLYFNGVQLCLPSRIFPAGYDFRAAVGQSCGPGGTSCRSGMCYVQQDHCMQDCCTDADCGQAPCSWSLTGNTLRSFCDGMALLGEPPGAWCGGGGDGLPECQSGICLPDAQSPQGGVCATPCCSEQDCPGGQGCAQVAGPWGPGGAQGAIAYACVTLVRGAGELGDPCVGPDDGGACASGLCVEGRCSRTCCTGAHCPADFACQVAGNGEGGYIRACITP